MSSMFSTQLPKSRLAPATQRANLWMKPVKVNACERAVYFDMYEHIYIYIYTHIYIYIHTHTLILIIILQDSCKSLVPEKNVSCHSFAMTFIEDPQLSFALARNRSELALCHRSLLSETCSLLREKRGTCKYVLVHNRAHACCDSSHVRRCEDQ